MSNAGQMAIDMAFRGKIPVLGFITFCATSAQLSAHEISSKKNSPMKEVLIAGSKDVRFFSHSVEMQEQFNSQGFNATLKKGNFGYEIPQNSLTYIDWALEFILKQG